MDIFASAGYAAKKNNAPTTHTGGFSAIFDLLTTMKAIAKDGKAHPTGSRFICNPPVMNTDEDYAVLAAGTFTEGELQRMGFIPSINANQTYASRNFMSYRKDHYNVILFYSEKKYDKYVTATLLAQRFNLKDKQDRIDLFQAVVDGKLLTP